MDSKQILYCAKFDFTHGNGGAHALRGILLLLPHLSAWYAANFARAMSNLIARRSLPVPPTLRKIHGWIPRRRSSVTQFIRATPHWKRELMQMLKERERGGSWTNRTWTKPPVEDEQTEIKKLSLLLQQIEQSQSASFAVRERNTVTDNAGNRIADE